MIELEKKKEIITMITATTRPTVLNQNIPSVNIAIGQHAFYAIR